MHQENATCSFLRIVLPVVRPCKGILLAFIWLFFTHTGFSQQFIAFAANGKEYRAAISWVVKYKGAEYKAKTEHTFSTTGTDAFDLAVNFNFQNDSVPLENDIVWGFQFSQNGDIISPAANEKRSRSKSLFQRFEITGSGTAGLTIVPKVWKRSAGGKFDPLGLGTPIKLSFNITIGSVQAPSDAGAPVKTPGPADSLTANRDTVKAEPATAEAVEENTAYIEATASADTLQKIKALRDFVDKYAVSNPKSVLVAKAIKNIPLGTSIPEKRSDGTVSYTLNYAVKPVVDSSQVRGWRWKLSPSEFGKYQLTLTSLHDSIQSFRIADLGKNAPFNQPKELRPFQRIIVRLDGVTRDSFRIKVIGGAPPFIVFLSQSKIPKWRQVLNRTDTVWAFSKDVCQICKSGPTTLEVYDSDLSTLLLKVDDAVRIFKINYFFVLFAGIAAILLVYFSYNPLRRYWRRYAYERKLRQIESWEEREEQTRKRNKQ